MKPNRTIDANLLPALAHFAQVARLSSFRQAAAVLGVSPSALSQTVRTLEHRVGARLLQRTTRTVGLTEAGQRLLEEAEPALARLASALQRLEDSRERPAGLLRITTPRFPAEHFLLPRLPAFHARYPQVQVELSIQPAMVDMVADGFDAGIRLGESLAPGMIAVPLGPALQFVVVGAPAYLAQHGVPDTPEALLAHRCIRHRSSDGRIRPWEFSRDGHEFHVQVDGPLLLNDSHLALQATRSGLGLQQAFTHNVQADVEAGRLIPLLEHWQPPFAGFHLYYPSRDQLPPKLRVFIDFMRQ